MAFEAVIFDELTAARLDVAPAAAVFLDDHPANVAGARAVGMGAVQVDDPMIAIEELRALLG
jgi:FMN phosphatase YigB (HAD superfamily)